MEKEIRDIDAENRKAKYRKYFCGHGKYKYRCKECKGSQICVHGRQKSYCKDCGGSQICSHDRQKQTCKECKGSQICVHDRQKQYCKKCKGSQICSHDREKKTCKECGGAQICPQDRRKRTCKKCSDPIKVSIKQWIISRRQYDKMRNIYDADRFIDKCFLEGLVEDYKQCYYGDCKDADGLGPVNLQYTEYQDDLAIIRLGILRATVFCAVCNVISRISRKKKQRSWGNLIYLS